MILEPKNNPLYNTKSSRGENPCILGNYPHGSSINDRTGYPDMNVLPNCVGFATARFNELAGLSSCRWLGNTDAKNFIKMAQMQSLSIGSEPKAGACIVWSSARYGHVAIVEQVLDDNTIIVTESGWSSIRPYWSAVHHRGNGNWTEGEAWMMSGYTFQGFIYNPNTEEEMTQEQFNAFMDNYLAERAQLPASKWAEEALTNAKAEGIIVGDGDGNQRPKSFVTREELAVVINKL